ncbi:MAG: sigma 54-interacting transcriptional regulator [Clostridium sp.]|uniref:sigma 54-interacting transcriptional regulator n=1 Tax=Clostridium culturomicium TaxID=1499683 RepID=UPI00058E708B|nr:sigma 54-interacting transcriptional regulator [Clostridium culturomicium]MDU4889487.1 sigma 54-interacting transcriptional regulator [Clostridium sp.]MDU7082869.1 sigma 54-interacting transcriptional regulator [Clostridium sp.]
MVKILMFIPHLDMKETFRRVVEKAPKYDDIKIELTHVFGTPEVLTKNMDAEIVVARGMTYDWLKARLPEKHMVKIELNSFDILDALVIAKEVFSPKRIALCIKNQEINSLSNLEKLCDAAIDLYGVYDEDGAEEAINEAMTKGTDVFVGAGTVCGLCDNKELSRVHIKTQDKAIERALYEAINTARTINKERTKANMINMILNSSEDAIIAVDDDGKILAINNQAYRTYQISTLEDVKNKPVEKVCRNLKWKKDDNSNESREELLKMNGNTYYVQYQPIVVDKIGSGTIIITKSADLILETETKIRRSLSEKGLTAKYSFENIIGASDIMKENKKMAKRYSQVDSNVLIIGETGTGKELFAHSIHKTSKRSKQPFVALNCAALNENLLESELFGYEPGAFSGASKNGKIGLFELAHKGTIFLDEIGEIPTNLQAKLLRVLQEKEIRRIGSDRVQPIDVRVISATNINIEEQVKSGKFRSDLYYRLNLLDIVIAPLRERKEDIQAMVDYYLTQFACEIGKPSPKLTLRAARILENYDWPGNVRELRNICERLIVLNDSGEITEKDIKQLKVFKEMLEPKIEIKHEVYIEEDDIYKKLKPKKKKKDIADELGVSRTTLWRMAKKQQELERNRKGDGDE